MTEDRLNAFSRRAKSLRWPLISLRHEASIATMASTWGTAASSTTPGSRAACGEDRWRKYLSKSLLTAAPFAFGPNARRSIELRWSAGPAAVWVKRSTAY
jgi:hypothetical protein